jgi:hypothetical protein
MHNQYPIRSIHLSLISNASGRGAAPEMPLDLKGLYVK